MLSTLASLAVRESLLQDNTVEPQNVSHVACSNGTLHYFPVSVRVVVGVTCVLSMVGALLIVLSYILIRDIRTKAREILVNLSLMDFMVAVANFIGVTSNLSEVVASDRHNIVAKNLCIAQASFAMYGTISSVLWTICVAVYVFLRIFLENSKIAQRSVYGFYVVCYGIPLIMTLWFSLTDKLGVDHYGGSGWCSLKVYNGHRRSQLNAIFGNDIWIYLTMILVPLIFISLHFYLRHQVKVGKAILTQNLTSAVQSVERKLILIPIIFILLRVWSLLLVLLAIEFEVHLNCTTLLFFLHTGGIGDSGQGFANAVLFVLFTPKVRKYFFKLCLCCCPSRCRPSQQLFAKKIQIQYGSVHAAIDDTCDGRSSATLSETSGLNEQDAKSLLLNAS